MSTWIMEDEENALELLELYEEARANVDQKIPRRGTLQADWLYSQGPEFLDKWLTEHNALIRLRRELA